ncbi:MAG: ABC transporter ATP-binding protein [Thaumarchaeota archaeon]|nr:ABC transporter ATP-binding protein [Nitrososphaerota archaeon]
MAVKAEDLWFSYGEGWALKGVSLEIPEGEIVAVVGPNGSGKTTFAKHLIGLLKPTRGRVLVYGEDTREKSVAELSRLVGYVFQNPNHQIFSETVYDEVAFGPRNLGFEEARVKELVESSLKLVGLEGKGEERPYMLSMGEKERLAIASVLAMDPRLLILDEPTIGQDRSTMSKLIEVVKRLKGEGRTVLLISHDIDLVYEHSDYVIVFKGGEVVSEGKVAEVLSDPELTAKASLSLPKLAELARLLGLDKLPSSVEDVVEVLLNEVRGIRKEELANP